ncbi:hypothetical protein [Thermus sp.]|uniref:hypothetical protein n=1 Tax=Thermus sp. TaxID=275 RepID=UPI00321F869B
MRALGLWGIGLLLAACTLTVEVRSPYRILRLETQPTYCTQGNTQLDYRLALEGWVDGLWFYWVPDGTPPSAASAEEAFYLKGPFSGLEVRGFLTVSPEGRVLGGVGVQGIRAEPLPDRRLWVRGVRDGILGPYVGAVNGVRPDSTSFCDPSW